MTLVWAALTMCCAACRTYTQLCAVRFLQATTFQNRGNHPITIASVAHSEHVPAGIQVVRGSGGVPNGGVLANNRGDVFATVSAQTFPWYVTNKWD